MEDLNWYTVLNGSHSFRGATARKGQDILLTDREAKKLSDRVRRKTMADEKVTETAKPTYEPTTVDETGSEVTETNRDWSSTQDMKAPDVISQVNESNSVKDLEALYDIEEKGQNRATVLKAIERRVATLEG